MAAIASVTLADGQVAPSNVVFTPQDKDANGVVLWLAPGSTLDERPRLSASVRLPKNGSAVSRVQARIAIPIMDTVDTTKKIGDAIFAGEFVLPKTVSLASRKNLLAFAKNFLDHAVIESAVHDLEAPF